RAAEDQRRRADLVEPRFKVGVDESACRAADDDDLAVERRDGRDERLPTNMREGEPFGSPRGDERGDGRLNLRASASALAQALDRLLRVDDEEYRIGRQAHGLGPS